MREVEVEVALSFAARLRGLILRGLPTGRGLLFPRCRGVHGFFMGRALDCVFLDAGNRVLSVGVLRPWRVLLGPPGSVGVLELEAGEAAGPAAGRVAPPRRDARDDGGGRAAGRRGT